MTGAVEVPPSQGPDNKNAFVVTTPPPWMDQAYFEKALQSYENDKDLKVNIFSFLWMAERRVRFADYGY